MRIQRVSALELEYVERDQHAGGIRRSREARLQVLPEPITLILGAGVESDKLVECPSTAVGFREKVEQHVDRPVVQGRARAGRKSALAGDTTTDIIRMNARAEVVARPARDGQALRGIDVCAAEGSGVGKRERPGGRG